MERLRTLFEKAGAQHGLIARWQVLGDVVDERAWKRLADRPPWEQLSRNVLRNVAAGPTAVQRALAGVLDAGPGAFLSSAPAAALWTVPGFSLRPVVVTQARTYGSDHVRLAISRRPRALPSALLTALDGVPIVRPELCIVELAETLSVGRLERALDSAWSRRLLTGAAVRRAMELLGTRGRHGVRALRGLLDARGESYVPPASNLEARVMQILRAAGEAPMDRQVDLGGGTWTGRVDFVDHRRCGVLEVDSERFHAALVDRVADAARQRQLEADGYEVARVTDVQVWQHPAEVLETVRDLRRRCRERRSRPAA
ncbi:MAG: DUF559 domain-containing protein [Actinobacteria bacterium]|nr:DUF559 domain-containing protein [Actinomycetota bacterium]